MFIFPLFRDSVDHIHDFLQIVSTSRTSVVMLDGEWQKTLRREISGEQWGTVTFFYICSRMSCGHFPVADPRRIALGLFFSLGYRSLIITWLCVLSFGALSFSHSETAMERESFPLSGREMTPCESLELWLQTCAI